MRCSWNSNVLGPTEEVGHPSVPGLTTSRYSMLYNIFLRDLKYDIDKMFATLISIG